MKLRAPTECRSVFFDGVSIVIDAKGCIEIDKNVAEILVAHGFELLDEQISESEAESSIDVTSLSRKELFQFLKEHNVSISLPITNEVLRNRAVCLLQNQRSETRRPR